MKTVTVHKIYCLDENYQFPKCHVCDSELTPFSITSKELNSMDDEQHECLISRNYLILNALDNDKHILYLCKKCLQYEIKEIE